MWMKKNALVITVVHVLRIMYMPSYEYACFECNMKLTLTRSIHEETMPMCCGVAMRQVYYAPSVEFKGDGWAGKP